MFGENHTWQIVIRLCFGFIQASESKITSDGELYEKHLKDIALIVEKKNTAELLDGHSHGYRALLLFAHWFGQKDDVPDEVVLRFDSAFRPHFKHLKYFDRFVTGKVYDRLILAFPEKKKLHQLYVRFYTYFGFGDSSDALAPKFEEAFAEIDGLPVSEVSLHGTEKS